MLDSLVGLMPFSSAPTNVVSPITLLQSLIINAVFYIIVLKNPKSISLPKNSATAKEICQLLT